MAATSYTGGLPFLPGNQLNQQLGRTRFHKNQICGFNNSVSNVDPAKPGIAGARLPGQSAAPRSSQFPSGPGPEKPAWVAFDKQVLRFNSFFQEAVHERSEEQFRVRRVTVLFYLEDDTVQINEGVINNSGIPQGTLLRRHRIPRPAPRDGEFYTVHDFNVGNLLTFYGRTYKLLSCDGFTNNFLTKLGVTVGAESDAPVDPYTLKRGDLDAAQNPLRPYEKADTLGQFLEHDREVLRFYGFWDDSSTMFGDKREMVVHYFLADDTIEVREVFPPNSGRDAASNFLARGKLPKDVPPGRQPGAKAPRTVLNVFDKTATMSNRSILDSLKTGSIQDEYYKDSDLQIGAVINCYGRPVQLCDCDDFTRNYYSSKYGVDSFQPIEWRDPAAPAAPREIPPYNGIGSEEDSLANCFSLIPKAAGKDMRKFLSLDRQGLDSHILRFSARLDTTRPIDLDRRFTISYFLSDDTIMVYEVNQRNSGILGGKFIERGRLKNPQGGYYVSQDLFVGANVSLSNFKFIVIDADEYVYNYYEQNQYPVANVKTVLEKIKGSGQDLNALKAELSGLGEKGGVSRIRLVLLRQLGGSISEHEVQTVLRYFVHEDSDQAAADRLLISNVKTQLRRSNFEHYESVHEAFLAYDTDGSGYLTEEELLAACKKLGLPIEDHLMREVFARIPKNEDGHLDYAHAAKFFDWRGTDSAELMMSTKQETEDGSSIQAGEHPEWKGNNDENEINIAALLSMLGLE